MKKVLMISDMNQKGSGYQNITTNLGNGLVDAGYEVKVVGMDYKKEEHWNKFSLIPVSGQNVGEMFSMVHNLRLLWKPDVIVFAFDIPFQGRFQNFCQQNKIDIPIIGIYPLESTPLSLTWAMMLSSLDKSLVISEFGAEEAIDKGIDAVHIPIGINREEWRKPTKEEKESFRMNMGIEENDFVVLTVAENQERKNLSASMEIIKRLSHYLVDSSYDQRVKWILVTREHLEVGWQLRDYWTELSKGNPHGEFIIYERGMPHEDLWMLYAASDAFLLTSKAEGLGMPVMEAMSVGLPVVGSDMCAIQEHLRDWDKLRGYPIDIEYVHRDVWQNAKRYYVSVDSGVDALMSSIYDIDKDKVMKNAEEYISSRTWDKAVKVLSEAIEEVSVDTIKTL